MTTSNNQTISGADSAHAVLTLHSVSMSFMQLCYDFLTTGSYSQTYVRPKIDGMDGSQLLPDPSVGSLLDGDVVSLSD